MTITGGLRLDLPSIGGHVRHVMTVPPPPPPWTDIDNSDGAPVDVYVVEETRERVRVRATRGDQGERCDRI